MKELGNKLIDWYLENKRDLPWRNTKNPYYIWVSEIMLQQTRVEAVIPYYERFIKALPTIQALSESDDEQLHKLWQGLGYYSRVLNMKQAAIQCQTLYNGNLPSTYEGLLGLKGIGPYCASAIASFAFHLPYPVVDGNVIRVCSRLWRIKEYYDTDKQKKALAQELTKCMPIEKCDLFNQAIMELGAMICIPNGAPKCLECPLQSWCEAYRYQEIEQYPLKKMKKNRKVEKYTVVILQYKNKIKITKREDGLLKGLYQFDMHLNHMSLEQIFQYYEEDRIISWKQLPSKRHIFTHKEWDLKTYWIKVECQREGLWIDYQQYENQYALSSAFVSYLKYISLE